MNDMTMFNPLRFGFETHATGGNRVFIYHNQGDSERPLHGAYLSTEKLVPICWDAQGCFADQSGLNLIKMRAQVVPVRK